ncbi:uncharacterized protein N7479_010193 [Penicillium vulpinum]|uniref:uncharacterized protein n=1 Tax=Penicillium vulpinum TaxID=29845 RepID=UPI002548B28E|nr:uncharacterized protein N7479_010193 [Penicillium vulpinum]KAJ5951780.1 hypothetical protein N7479_010193 [Penicillium vulpinum]
MFISKEKFYDIKDLGEPKQYLNCALHRDYDKRTITISQKVYIQKVLRTISAVSSWKDTLLPAYIKLARSQNQTGYLLYSYLSTISFSETYIYRIRTGRTANRLREVYSTSLDHLLYSLRGSRQLRPIRQLSLSVKWLTRLYYQNNVLLKSIRIISIRNSYSLRKELDLQWFFVKDTVAQGYIDIRRVDTKRNAADRFTKALPREQFEIFVVLIGMI